MKKEHLTKNKLTKKIWIDLDNSPHVPFFKPIIEELEKREYKIFITARRCFQVCELADLLNIRYEPIGYHHGKNKLIKLIGLLFRSGKLLPSVIKKKPRMALSHGSRAQLITAKLLGIPSCVIYDYEYCKNLPFVAPRWAISPEIINYRRWSKGVQIFYFQGIKEDIYIPNFRPNPRILKEIGLKENVLLITIRPPATEAHYHINQSEKLFEEVIDYLGYLPNLQIALLPRNYKQENFAKQRWPILFDNKKITIPNHVVDGLSLIWYSDLVISGGGTMNREAAALGVPVYSIFRSKIGAVDRFLSDIGRLTIIKNAKEISDKIMLERREKIYMPDNNKKPALQQIVNHIEMMYKQIS